MIQGHQSCLKYPFGIGFCGPSGHRSDDNVKLADLTLQPELYIVKYGLLKYV